MRLTVLAASAVLSLNTAAADELTVKRMFEAPSLTGPSPRSLQISPDSKRVTFIRASDTDVLRQVLADAGLDADGLIAATADPEVKAELIRVTEEAVARGAFGAPTMYLGDEMFFGQDRLDFIEEALAGSA